MTSRLVRILIASIAFFALATGLGLASWHKTVAVTVDGETREVSGFMVSVGDALGAAGIVAGEHDVVTPSADTRVQEGTAIDVRFGRPLEVVIDGSSTTYWTTETTLATALGRIGLSLGQDARLSEATSRSLGREGLSLTVTTPKTVTLVVAGQSASVTSTAPTVADLLRERQLSAGDIDRLNPAADAPVTAGMTVTLDRVERKDVTRTEPIAFTTTKQDDSSLMKGVTQTVTKGVAGTQAIVEKQTIVNGALESAERVSAIVAKQPVNAVVKVGTKTPPAGSTTGSTAINTANAAMWDRIARCESGNRWNINTGNGYYGGLQFNNQTWLSSGGADFAPRADLATREQQITVANRLYAKRGLQPWGCRGAA